MKICEFTYKCEEQRKISEISAIKSVITKYLDDIVEGDRLENHKKYGDVFNKIIAFKLEYEIFPPYQDDNYNIIKEPSERITLEPINIQKIKVETPITMCCRKLNFKERIKVLFTGILKY